MTWTRLRLHPGPNALWLTDDRRTRNDALQAHYFVPGLIHGHLHSLRFEVLEWLDLNCSGWWLYHLNWNEDNMKGHWAEMAFADPKDAMIFKLTWA